MKDYRTYSDEKLTALLLGSEPTRSRAFDVMFDRYSTRLNAYCHYRTGSVLDAEELLQDTWLKFLDAVEKGRRPKKVLPYLYTIARNLAADRYREKNAVKTIGIEYTDTGTLDELSGGDDFLTQADSEEIISLVRIAVKNLDEIYRETFVLFWFGGLSYKDIAGITEVNEGSAKMRCHRAMAMVREMLKPWFAEISE